MKEVDSTHGRGVIVIVSGDLARYAEFPISMLRVRVPRGTAPFWARGVSIAGNLNMMIHKALKADAAWVWIMGDDHVFDADLLMNLLDRGVDIIAPLCARRRPPYMPHVYGARPDGLFDGCRWEWLPREGVAEVGGAGTAGMVIRRHVLETMPAPWFEVGRTQPDALGEDLWFCRKAREAGFKVYVDCENKIGHIAMATVWPVPGEGVVLDCGETLKIPLQIDILGEDKRE